MDHYVTGTAIRQLRERKNMTQAALAEVIGVSPKTVSKWEKGTTEPSTSNLFAIAKLFDMPIEEFWTLTDDIIEGAEVKKPYSSKPGKIIAKVINKVNKIFKR